MGNDSRFILDDISEGARLCFRSAGENGKHKKWMKEPESVLSLSASCWHVLNFLILSDRIIRD